MQASQGLHRIRDHIDEADLSPSPKIAEEQKRSEPTKQPAATSNNQPKTAPKNTGNTSKSTENTSK